MFAGLFTWMMMAQQPKPVVQRPKVWTEIGEPLLEKLLENQREGLIYDQEVYRKHFGDPIQK